MAKKKPKAKAKAKKRPATVAMSPSPSPSPSLKERHRKFVENYMQNGGNGVEAARAAGYRGTNKALASRAAELTHRPEVQAAIQTRVDNDPAVSTRQDRQRWWTEVMRDQRVGMKERIEASKLIARAQGDFVDRKEVSVNGGVVIFLPDNGRGDGSAPVAPKGLPE